jgi:hypothetical protein
VSPIIGIAYGYKALRQKFPSKPLTVAEINRRWEKQREFERRWKFRAARIKNSIFVQGLLAIKGRVCPIIEITE